MSNNIAHANCLTQMLNMVSPEFATCDRNPFQLCQQEIISYKGSSNKYQQIQGPDSRRAQAAKSDQAASGL